MAPTIVLMQTDYFKDGLVTIADWFMDVWNPIPYSVQPIVLLILLSCAVRHACCAIIKLWKVES